MAGKTLDELENVVRGPPKFDSHLVSTCHRLRSKPIEDFTIEDLRIMIGQEIGLAHLMPRALEVLEHDPLAEGDDYPGDLLANVLSCRKWLRSQPELLARITLVAGRALEQVGDEDEDLRNRITDFLAATPEP